MADRKISALSALTTPAEGDLLPVVDVSEAANADKNKSITLSTLFRRLPDGSVGAPAIGFLSDTGTSGIYRTAANEVAFTNNSTFNGKFTTAGFQLGTGTAAAQLHLFSTDTTDQVIIENSDAGADTAPDVVLYRNSASPAASDNLGNFEFRGKDSNGDDHTYAQLVGGISDPTNTSEDGILDLSTTFAGTNASRIRLSGRFVGIGEGSPAYPMHLTTDLTGTALNLECSADDPSSGADLTLFHRRGASSAGQDEDALGSVFFRGKNDAGTPAEVDYAGIEGKIVDASDATEDGGLSLQVQTAGAMTTQLEIGPAQVFVGSGVATDAAIISTVNFRGANDNTNPEDINYAALVGTVVDASDGTEDGRLQVQTMTAGTLATRLDITENKIGFFGATAAVQSTHVADITTTASSGALPAANDTNTIADATAPTNAELLQYCVTLEAKVEALLAFASAHGLMASS
tara:strand:+ start:10263 stop:11648 length:1386 start_codon:yes stop_codon:yes gene_type:complete